MSNFHSPVIIGTSPRSDRSYHSADSPIRALRPRFPKPKTDEGTFEDQTTDSPTPTGVVTDEEIVEVAALLQLTHSMVFLFLAILGLWSISDPKKDADHIPDSFVILLQMGETLLAILAAVLNKWAPLWAKICCGKSYIYLRIIAYRVIAFIMNIVLLTFNAVEVFWPTKTGISPIVIGTLFFIESSVYLCLLFFSGRLLIRNKHGENRFTENEETEPLMATAGREHETSFDPHVIPKHSPTLRV